jgi:hypothetical protein
MPAHQERGMMIANDQEFQITLERIERFQRQLAYLRQVEKNPANDCLKICL